MHITLVAMLALLGAKRVLRLWPGLHGRVPAQSAAIWAAFPCALLYGGLAGWSVSVQRALLMLAVVFVFGVAERHLRAWLAFGCALLLVLVLQPMAALQTGFWLSFLAVAALIFVFSGRVRRPTRLQLLWQPQLVIAVEQALARRVSHQNGFERLHGPNGLDGHHGVSFLDLDSVESIRTATPKP